MRSGSWSRSSRERSLGEICSLTVTSVIGSGEAFTPKLKRLRNSFAFSSHSSILFAVWAADRDDQGNVNISGVPSGVLKDVAEAVAGIVAEVEAQAIPAEPANAE